MYPCKGLSLDCAQMRELERKTAMVYTPFRAALFEFAVRPLGK